MKYTVGIGFDEIRFYSISLEQVKAVVKMYPAERIDYIVHHCDVNPQFTDAMDLFIDANDNAYWETIGDQDWREFLIDENR